MSASAEHWVNQVALEWVTSSKYRLPWGWKEDQGPFTVTSVVATDWTHGDTEVGWDDSFALQVNLADAHGNHGSAQIFDIDDLKDFWDAVMKGPA